MAEKIKITFLGTGSAIPTEKRNHPSIFLEYKNEGILFDCGEGTQRQFRIAKLNPCKIKKILISHWHADHVLGIPGLLQTLSLNNYNKELCIYGPVGTKKFFSFYNNLFINKTKPITIKIFEIADSLIEEEDFFIESKEMKHNSPCLAFSFITKDKKRIDKEKLKKLKIPNSPLIRNLLNGKKVSFNGKIIDGKKIVYLEKGKKISYITDTLPNNKINLLIKNSDLLISECTYSSEEKELAEEHFHLTSDYISKEAKKSKVKKLILFHLSQRYESSSNKILDEAKRLFKETKIAEDFDKIVL